MSMYFYNVEIILHPQEVIFLVFDLFNVIAHILGWKKTRNGILFFLFYYLFLTNIIIWLCPVDIKSKGRLVYIGSIKQIVSWQIVLLIVKLVCLKPNFRSCSLILVDRVGFFALVDTIIQVICPSVRIPMYPTICQGNVSRSLS